MENKDNITLSNKVITNFGWRFGERIGAKGVEFLVSIVLARLLLPADYGTIALVTVFVNILQVFVDSGLGNALIQKKDADDLDFSSVFYFNLLFCLVLYLLLFFLAPYIALFYNNYSLTAVIRVLGITIIISGIKNVQQAYVSKKMLFKRFFFSTLGGTIVAAFFGVILAYMGYGVWALVTQQILNISIDTAILWVTVNWRPRKCFSFSRLKQLYSYGWKLLVSQMLEIVFNDLRQLIIGKIYSASDLGIYNRANQFPQFVSSNINTSINSVLFPAMSSTQDDKRKLKAMTRRAITISTYIMAPLLMGLAACAKPVVRLVLTEKWLPVVPFMRVFCISHMFLPIHTANLNAIKALGRSDLYLRLEIYKKVIGLVLLLLSVRFGMMAMAYSMLLSGLISQLINTWPNKKLLEYRYLDQIRDVLPSIFLAGLMGVIVHFIEIINLNDLLIVIIQIVVGAFIYICLSAFLQLESFKYLIQLVKGSIRKQRTFLP